MLPEKRESIYSRLESQIGATPLYQLTHIPVENNCRIVCKEEYLNPTASHYDRETVALLRGYETTGKIIAPGEPGYKPLLETTTGSSGASFAWMCRVLGYECQVIIPEDMPAARIEQIRSYGAEVKTTPKGSYIGGLVGRIEELYTNRKYAKEKRKYKFTNHSMDVVYGPAAMECLAREVLEQLGEAPDYFVAALGNGISAHGVSNVLGPEGTKMVGMEPYESPTVLREKFPERFAQVYPGGHLDVRHEIYGTGPGADAKIKFPNIAAILERLDHIRLPTPEQWRQTQLALIDIEAKHVGNSSAATVWAALELAKEARPHSTILVIFYDAYWRYLPIDVGGAVLPHDD